MHHRIREEMSSHQIFIGFKRKHERRKTDGEGRYERKLDRHEGILPR